MESKPEIKPRSKEKWEPMRLTAVGDLGGVMTGNPMSGADGGTTTAMMG